MQRHILIIANPIAGGGKGLATAKELAQRLEAEGCTVELFLTQKAGDARQRAAAGDRVDTLVSVGGDGTLNEVLNGMPDLSVPLAMLPMGTANVLAAELRLPRKPAQAAAAIVSGHCRHARVGVVDGRRFLLFVGVGLDGAMVRRLEEVRTGTLGKLKWSGPAWHVIRRWPRYDLDIHAADGPDGARSLTGLTSVLITRVRSYGGLFHMVRGIRIDDEWLHVLAFRQRSRASWLRALARALWGGLRPGRDVEWIRCRSVSVRCAHGPAAPYQIDGEFGGDTPLEVGLLEAPIGLVCPQ